MNLGSWTIISLLLISSINSQAEWLPFTLKNNHITVDIEFNGQPARAMLDSGAESNAVSAFYVERYNEGIKSAGTVNVKGVSGTQKRRVYNNVPVKLFGVDFTLDKLPAMSLAGSAILLGSPFFTQFIVQIDYPNSRIQLFPKKSIDMDKFKNVNIKRQRGTLLPAIEVKVNDKSVWLTLDTGNNGGLYIKRSYAIENHWLDENTDVIETQVAGVNGASNTETFGLQSLSLGPYELENILVTIPAEGETSAIGRRSKESGIVKRSKQTMGLLGYDVLKHFVVTIDYSNYKVHLVAP